MMQVCILLRGKIVNQTISAPTAKGEPMAKYVDVEKEFCDYCGDRDRCGSPNFFCNVKSMVAADVAPVVHGRWKKNWHNSLIGHEYEECSVCGCMISDTEKFWDCNYCPNCGADMREVEE